MAAEKAVLYNAAIEIMLKNTDGENTISVFKKNDEVVLLRCPHSLFGSTLESIRSELLVEYRDIVEEYKSDKIGISDDDTEWYGAVTLSDAHYGD